MERNLSFYNEAGELVGSAFWPGCGWGEDCSATSFDLCFGADCAEPVLGCTDSSAENFNAEADTDDGSCTWNGGCASPSYSACDNGDVYSNIVFL